MSSSQKVLWITHHWPPLMSTCANMAHAFVDHLALQGISVFVVTPEIPGITLPPVVKGVSVHQCPAKGDVSFWRKMTSLTKGDADWFFPALAAGRTILNNEKKPGDKWAVIGSSGAKTVCFEVATLLATEINLPLVLDYRDPWTLNEAVNYQKWKYAKKIPKLALARQKEKRILSKADLVLCRSEGLKSDLLTQFASSLKKVETVVIPNAVDERLLSPFQTVQPATEENASIKLLFKGRGSGREKELENLFEACKLLAQQSSKPVALTLLGMGSQFEGSYQNFVVSFKEGLAQEELIQALAKQTFLVTTVPKSEAGRETGTLWLYVASGKPILALVPINGCEARGVAMTQHHKILSPDAPVTEILTAITALSQLPTLQTPHPIPEALAGTHMKRLKLMLENRWGN